MVPQPDPDAVPFNNPAEVELDQNQRGTITFTPTQSSTTFYLPTLAISKFANTTYEVHADGEAIYGPAPVPPTDVDDLAVTFIPAQTFDRELKVIITNSGTPTRTYSAQPLGWEERE